MLTPELKQKQVDIIQELLWRYEHESDEFLKKNIVRGDYGASFLSWEQDSEWSSVILTR